jgi:uncharacterized cupin superfamily protein
MLKLSNAKFGNLTAMIYDFEFFGDKLGMHTHEDADNHITIVNRGTLVARGNDWEMVLKVGQVADWIAGQAHEFEAIEDDCRIINIVKGAPV